MQSKKNIIILSIGAITLMIAVLGATYAFFTAQGGGSGNTSLDVGTSTTDNLSFNAGSAINLNINQDNFAQGAGNQAGSTKASAILTANNATNSATANYYLYLNILSNNLEYTTEEETAELILTIKDPKGSPVTTLSGYNYVTVGEVSGFDITTKEGLIKLADNYEIVSTGTETQEWEITVTFVNLETDQNDNTAKNFSASLIIQEELISTNLSDVCPDGGNMADCVISLYDAREEGENGLYYHDGIGSYANVDQEAGDNSYRYAGANPNNYVCFGSDVSPCSIDNLYRIIGVFDGQVKLIKGDYATHVQLGTNGAYNQTYEEWGMDNTYKGSMDGSAIGVYYWNNGTGTNTWNESDLNKINLNQNYLNNIGSKWSNMIATHTWEVGRASYSNVYNSPVKTAYNYEVGPNKANTTYNAKIGLMYTSDYGYAASPSAWNINLGSYNNSTAKNNNWVYMGLYEWAISRRSDTTNNAFAVVNTGHVSSSVVYNNNYGVRPSFYLESTVEFSGGSGTSSAPYRIVA